MLQQNRERHEAFSPNASLLPDLRTQLTGLKPQNHTPEQFESLLTRALTIAQDKRGVLRVGMYDGSFDPPHFGHIETARAAVPVARLDLLVLNCHPKSNYLKPNLSPHILRTEMLSSYFLGDPLVIVSPLSRDEITQTLKLHRIVGIIGSDTFNRFLHEGIAPDFKTNEIFVSERRDHPLETAPVTLADRRVWYIGRSQLAQNYNCSTSIRDALADPESDSRQLMLSDTTQRVARENNLYSAPSKSNTPPSSFTAQSQDLPSFSIPTMYRGCEIVQRVGLENGLLSESFIFEVRDQSGETIAYMKTLPPRRNPESMLRDEAAGLAFCNSLRLHRVSSPQAYFSKSPPSLWITKAPGQTIGSIITDYDRGLVSAERIYQALFAVGNFLQKLHTRFPQPFDGKAREMLEAYIAHHEEILRVADPLELREQSVQDAIEIFRSESDHLRNVGVRCALLHGDANCGNFLWEPQTQLLSVIDLQRLGTQIRTGGRGFAAFEYRSLLSVLGYYPNIGFLGVRGGLELARDAFKTGYGEIDQHEDRFFTSIRYIRRALAGNQRVHEITRPPVPI